MSASDFECFTCYLREQFFCFMKNENKLIDCKESLLKGGGGRRDEQQRMAFK